MIFVTVGTGKFDELIKKIDEIAPRIKKTVIVQIGNGEYIPKNIKYFRFKPNLVLYYKKAELVISHGGAGTIYELLAMKKKVIGVVNTNRTDRHQVEILKTLSEQSNLIWGREIGKVEDYIAKAKNFRFKEYKKPECDIADRIKEFLSKN